MERLVSALGLIVLVFIAVGFSENRSRIKRQQVVIAIGAQFLLAILIFGVPALDFKGPLSPLFSAVNNAFLAILDFTLDGSRFIFGHLADSKKFGFIFAFQVLPTIIFMSSLMAVLYHWKVMQKVVAAAAFLMQKILGTSGAETLSVAANIFVGQTEAPLVVKPFVKTMTRSELLAVMTGGMATVAGGVMAAYVGLLKDRIPDIAGHLLTASVMSAPAALAIAKIIIPETSHPDTLGRIPKDIEVTKFRNTIEAAARGAGEGLSLALNVAAMLLAFIALIACVDALLNGIGELIHFQDWGARFVPQILVDQLQEGETVSLNLSVVFGWLFAPVAYLMGVPLQEVSVAGSLLGQKIVLNEFVAYLNLAKIGDQLSDRTLLILSYALCGFANFSSIAIQIGGIGGMAPSRKSDLAELGLKSVIGGSLAAFMTATIAGILI